MKEYIDKAIRTESLDLFKVDNPRLLHAAIGVNTEVGELLLSEDDVNLKEEVGDVLWYIAIAADEIEASFDELHLLGKLHLEKIDRPVEAVETLFEVSLELLDLTKRACFYGVALDEVRFANALGAVLECLKYGVASEGITLEECMDANIRKLSLRYPDKFTTEAAVNRDLKAEREELEK